MNNIYHKHTSSNSYWDSSWSDEDYYLCETEEEYQKLMAELKAKRQAIEEKYNSGNRDYGIEWQYHNFRFTPEGPIHASEYYYGHEWQGKTFDAIGFTWYERLERSSHTKHYLKPGSVGEIKPCKDPGIGWMYGS